MNEEAKKEIFIHSLFRTGSTYLFNVFRRSERGYCCYQEPLNEHLLFACSKAPEQLLDMNTEMSAYLHHPDIDKPYYYEFYLVADKVAEFFQEEFSYEQYFSHNCDEINSLKRYFDALANNGKGYSVFQCCRTMGRVKQLKTDNTELHIFLYRNPWDQWWSYNIDNYFGQRNVLIANAKDAPLFLVMLRKELNLELDAINCTEQNLSSADSYKLFYAIWCHSFLEAKPYCDIEIDIDQLSQSIVYRDEIYKNLGNLGLTKLDFSDCDIPTSTHGKSEVDFYYEIELQIHELLTSHGGYQLNELTEIIMLSKMRISLVVDEEDSENYVRDVIKTKKITRRYMDKIAVARRDLSSSQLDVQQARLDVQQARSKVQQFEAQLSEVYNSHSWQITKPLRKIIQLIRR